MGRQAGRADAVEWNDLGDDEIVGAAAARDLPGIAVRFDGDTGLWLEDGGGGLGSYRAAAASTTAAPTTAPPITSFHGYRARPGSGIRTSGGRAGGLSGCVVAKRWLRLASSES